MRSAAREAVAEVLAIVGWTLFVVVVTYAATLAYVAPIQCENQQSISPDKRLSNPVAQASVDRERERRQKAEHRLAKRDSALEACMTDRSMLQATKGIHLPTITAIKGAAP